MKTKTKAIIGLLALAGVAYSVVPAETQTFVVNNSFVETIQSGSYTSYDIRFNDELGSPESIKSVIEVLQHAQSGDVVTFHIIGAGGVIDSLVQVINAIHSTKAHVVMSVEGPAYSAYAVLATQGHELKMAKYSFLMFHTSSLLNVDCKAFPGTDRGVSNVEHCQAYYDANMQLWYSLLSTIDVLSKAEKEAIVTGHDVYIFPNGTHIVSTKYGA